LQRAATSGKSGELANRENKPNPFPPAARGVHKLGHVPDPTDLQEDQIRALHATSAPAEMKLAVTSEGDNRGNLTD
jgi:hypothetical protein